MLARGQIIIGISILASLITIFVFFTGKSDIKSLFFHAGVRSVHQDDRFVVKFKYSIQLVDELTFQNEYFAYVRIILKNDTDKNIDQITGIIRDFDKLSFEKLNLIASPGVVFDYKSEGNHIITISVNSLNPSEQITINTLLRGELDTWDKNVLRSAFRSHHYMKEILFRAPGITAVPE